jgi:protein-disulfide isomerase
VGGILAVTAVATAIIMSATAPAAAGPLNMASEGIVLTGPEFRAIPTSALPGDAEPQVTPLPEAVKATVQVFVDFGCPACKTFETANATQLEQWMQSGVVAVQIHPIAILDNAFQGSKYSTRTANLAACVANYSPDAFWPLTKSLYAQQPAEGTTGLTDEELLAIAKEAGVTSYDQVAKCVKDRTFKDWVGAATKRALAGPIVGAADANLKVTGTPTILVNGVPFTGNFVDPNTLASFVSQQSGGAVFDPTGSQVMKVTIPEDGGDPIIEPVDPITGE